jgi:hypothetical protein
VRFIVVPLVVLGIGVIAVAWLLSYAAFVVNEWFKQTFERR